MHRAAARLTSLTMAAALLAACVGQPPSAGSAAPPDGAPVTPTTHPANPPSPPTAELTPGPTPASPTGDVICSPDAAETLRQALTTGELAYAYHATGEQRFPGMKRDVPFAYEGARAGDVRWWRRLALGAGYHDEAVGDGTTSWLRWPFERLWHEDTDDEAELSDPLADMLRATDWQAAPGVEGCLLGATYATADTTVEYRLELDGLGLPRTAREAGRRPAAPPGEGVPVEWAIDYDLRPELPDLPAMPPAPLPADDATVLAMLAVNDAPDAHIIWRATAGTAEVVAFAGPTAHGFVAWEADGQLVEAAVLDDIDAPANLLQFGAYGDIDDDADDVHYAVAIVLDERVSSLRLRDADGRRTLAIGVPGGLVELVGYVDGWRFYDAAGSRLPRPR